MIEANKAELKGKYDTAKRLGEQVNSARSRINSVKAQLEAVRQKRAAAELSGDAGGLVQEEEALKARLEEEKRGYKEGFAQVPAALPPPSLVAPAPHRPSAAAPFHVLPTPHPAASRAQLKELKSEIEHLQHLLEQSRRRLQQDFEKWYATQHAGEAPMVLPPGPQAARSPQPHGSSRASPAPSPQRGGGARAAARGGPPLTGNQEVDQEIMAFYKAREKLVHDRMARGQ